MTAFEKRLLIMNKILASDIPVSRVDIEDLIDLCTSATLNILNELIKSGFIKKARQDVKRKYMGYVATEEAREWFKF